MYIHKNEKKNFLEYEGTGGRGGYNNIHRKLIFIYIFSLPLVWREIYRNLFSFFFKKKDIYSYIYT